MVIISKITNTVVVLMTKRVEDLNCSLLSLKKPIGLDFSLAHFKNLMIKNDEIRPYKDWKISWDQMKVTICEMQNQNDIQRAVKDSDTFANFTMLNFEIILMVFHQGSFFRAGKRTRKTDWGRIYLQPAEPCSKSSYVHFA